MVGNGVTTWEYDTVPGYVEMAYQHGLYSSTMEKEKEDLNCDFAYIFFDDNRLTKECEAWLDKFDTLTQDINIYEIYNGNGSDETMPGPKMYGSNGVDVPMEDLYIPATYADYTPWAFRNPNSKSAYQTLGGVNAAEYLNKQEVRDALHIPSNVRDWAECSDIDFPYDEKASLWAWKELRGQGYKMLKFSGDVDGAVPTAGTRHWIQDTDWPVTEASREWDDEDGLFAGLIEVRDDFTFATVHGAGHMVPQFRPKQGYHLIMNFVKGNKI